MKEIKNMPSPADQKLWEQEQEFVAQEKEKHPELFTVSPKSPDELFSRIGILNYPKNLPHGYIKYSPLDFIVEEILQDGTTVNIDAEILNPKAISEGQGTIYADIIKVGISTLDAVERIATALDIDIKQIGYAGIKDAMALTGQTISIRGETTIETIKNLSVPGIIIKNVVEGKGVIQTGSLKGNRFTLFIRTEKPIAEDEFQKNIETVNRRGVPNYFGTQRFGSPRFLSHLFGLHLLRGDLKETVKTYFFKTSEFEYPFVTKLREEAAKHFGDWPAVEKIFSALPYTFRHEMVMLEILKQTGKSQAFVEALSAIDRQVDLWARAYASFLNNLFFSGVEKAGLTLPENTPQLLTENPETHKIYKNWLTAHGTTDFVQNLKRLHLTSFIHLGNAAIPSRIKPEIHAYKITPEGVAICFDLPKGVYESTVLMFLFEIIPSFPIPNWLNVNEIDSKKILNLGSLEETRARLKDLIEELNKKRQEKSNEVE